MSRLSLVLAAVVVVCLVAACAAFAKVRTMRAALVTTAMTVVDNPPTQASPDQPLSPGDEIVFTDRIVSGGRTVGTNQGVCVAVAFPKFLCSTSAQLKGGTIAFAGIYDAATKAAQHIAIVGGTGVYRGARGEYVGRNVSATRFDGVATVVT